jgi:formate dehydrogenase iron-sulfur subunit
MQKYGRNRLAEGKLPVCAEQCATKALLGGDANLIAGIYRDRVGIRDYGPQLWGWEIAYREGSAASATTALGAGRDDRRSNRKVGDTQNRPRELPR